MAEGDLRWRYDTGSEICSGIVVGSDGVIYFGTDWPCKIIALNPDGSLKWEYATRNSIWGGLALSNDESVVYGGCNDDYLYGIYTATGLLKFSYDSGYTIKSGIAVDDNDKIYFGNANEIQSLNFDGTLNWLRYHGASYSQFSIRSNYLYAVVLAGNLYKLNLSDGSEVWHTTTAASTYGSGVPIAADGTIYFGGLNNIAYAINPDGTTKWSHDAGGNIDSAIGIGSNGNIWFGVTWEVNKVMVLRPSDGALVWDYPLPNLMGSGYDTTGLALDSNDIVYVGCWDNKLYAINSDGSLRWTYTTGNNVESGIAFSPNEDTVYFGSNDGYLYAIEKLPAPPSCGIVAVGDKVMLCPIGNRYGNTVALKSGKAAVTDKALIASLNNQAALKLDFRNCNAKQNDKVVCVSLNGVKKNILGLR